ncbi:GntR family transcriptional regulator [Caproiciproducens galactitolivorans]|uniref:GntR family transcriptional regulator n=1 Tax=Caproiciproducens galactitolivorans TaxID=642589 RepID=A0ABT4BW97_9FIRM|nr:GntR family transcriptional regulator [Caproiciproducens galactitolivorans]MCY1715173.1 GntR family transcriptional regulator [Caproiciproducens galactitolivorans]
MLDENSPLSLYYQVKSIIIDNIKNKVWTMNSKIPAERELCEMYKVSRITVRQALKELEDEGYLYRKQGKGTFVTGQKFVQRLSQFYSFSEEIAKMGAIPSTKTISFDISEADPLIAEKLQIGSNEMVFAIKRLRLADNEPFGIETSYVVYKYAMELKEEDVNQFGLYNALKLKCGVIPNEATETFEAVNVGSEDAKYLNVSKNAAALHLNRITSANGNKIEYCVSTIRGDKYKYTIQLGSTFLK